MRLDPDRLAELKTHVGGIVRRRGLASCQYALALEGEIVAEETFGDAGPGDRYWLASSTKILPTAVVWRLIGEGALDPALPVATWWPEFAREGKGAITLEQVMGHSSGLPNGNVSVEGWTERDRRCAEIEAWTCEWDPGSRFVYHGTSAYWILAELITRVTGMGYLEAIRTLMLDPLELTRLELGVPRERQGDVLPLVPTGEPASLEEFASVLAPELLSVIAPGLANMGVSPQDDPVLGSLIAPEGLAAGVPGASAVSDATSLALLYQALLTNPDGLWDQATLTWLRATVVNRHPTPLGIPCMRGYGIEVAGEGTPEERLRRIGSGHTSPATFGHPGAGGQVAWADPASGLSFVFLTNGWDRHLLELVRRPRSIDEHVARCLVS